MRREKQLFAALDFRMNMKTQTSLQHRLLSALLACAGLAAVMSLQAQPASAGATEISGTVVLPDGESAAGAQVGFKQAAKPLYLREERLEGYPNDTIATTDAAGRFTLPEAARASALFAVHAGGYARVPATNLTASPRVVLERWGNIEGILRVGSQPATNVSVRIVRPGPGDNEELTFGQNDFNAVTDAQGRFHFDRVPPGERSIYRFEPQPNGSWSGIRVATVQVKPGTVTRVGIGGTGRPVIGTLALNLAGVKVNWNGTQVSLHTPQPADAGDSSSLGAWLNADPVHRHLYRAQCSTDGSFRMEDVVAGDYELTAGLSEQNKENPQLSRPTAGVVRDVAMPDMPNGRSDEPLDLDTVLLKAYHQPVAGEAAAEFETKTWDGKTVKLADYRGKYVLLDLEHSLPGTNTPALQAVSKTWSNDDRLFIITLCPNTGSNVATSSAYATSRWLQGDLGDSSRTAWLKDYNVYWYFGAWGRFGSGGWGAGGWITSMPAIFLIGPDGKLLAVDLRGDAIQTAVSQALGRK